MAVNNGCPDPGCQKAYGQSNSSNNGGEDGPSLYRTRTASPENGRSSPTIFNPYYTGRPRTPANGAKSNTIDRQEIIRRIKSGGSRPTSPELEKSNAIDRQELIRKIKSTESRPTSPELDRPSSSGTNRKRRSPVRRIPTPGAVEGRPKSPEVQQDNQSIGMQIERPRSALHRGDFREREQTTSSFERFGNTTRDESASILSTSPVAPWHPQFPSALRHDYRQTQPALTQNGLPIPTRPTRDRAVSNASLAASFVYKPPTSPLVQSSRPDTPEPAKSPSPDRSRRHTFSPQSFKRFQSALEYPASARNHSKPVPPLRSERTFPYQAHQPRRSLHSTPFSSLPHTPSPDSRRPSLFAESPLHHAPMVGSYEESILRGRMSTIPSRPLNFMAQIGVLGKGNCKANLKCPPHVSVPFPAVFYSYGSGTKTPASDQPSPYVGLVDLENNLPHVEESREKRRDRPQGTFSNEGSRANSPRGMREDGSTSDAQARRRRRQKTKRRSGSPKSPPGGSYRIPQQGQLQIVIKNPNKTAVKLFLVPYDLSDMEPGQKTFIRQRSYSAGPIIDMPLSSRNNLGTDRPEASLCPTEDLHDRPMLRYLIHLHICCPSKGRYFLYKSVRVVFANRVPDGKEKLRNEIQLPEPRYSAYKSSRDSLAANASVSTGSWTKDPSRRRSAVLESNIAPDDVRWPPAPHSMAQSLPSHEYAPARNDVPTTPMPTLPRHFTTLPALESRPSSRHVSDINSMDLDDSTSPSVRSQTSSDGEQKLVVLPSSRNGLQDPFEFPRDRSRPSSRNESLLSKRLLDLAVQNQNQNYGNTFGSLRGGRHDMS
ncbi:hypothetical protein M409DRAFT_59126 [Zasmidium cellare ATCC 36951]|uniref:Atos-like conserved domain-containing protein n=1 Tax=Zasmidium cellare ATCC 36951 TaxID=1080233 RepID=A0A6A6C5F0_ZASCE|nr:uncharacterized protein M409DRAFT_59126 [Zasmidium cellare ATCC 36951]KAF2161420.1 hypothetical protein M409DRAFT_59126 [Zasmidium cellare ATCC 36951]